MYIYAHTCTHTHTHTHTTLFFPVHRIGQYRRRRAFLSVQWLILCAYTAGGWGFAPQSETIISTAKKNFFNLKKKRSQEKARKERKKSSNPTLQDLSSLSSPTTNCLIILWSSFSPLIDTARRMFYEM